MNPNFRPPNLVLDSRVEYQFGRMLGRGGYGAVYQGLNINNGDFVAIKQINLSAIPKGQIGGIMTEIDLLKKLKHENIVKYIGYLKTKEFLNIVLEYVENGSLSSIVKSMGRFPEPLVRVYITQVLQGLLYLHEQGVVHRDIKGANILSTKKGHVKLADFGVAQEKSAAQDTNCVVGTPYWMAPEIIELAGASPLSDIWSVGCTVIELVTGDPPYFDLPPMPALFRIVQDDHPPIPPQLSPALKDFLMECFQKDPLLRIDAKRLLKHPWIKSNTTETIPQSLDLENVKKNIMSHEEELEKTSTISITGKLVMPRKDSVESLLLSPRNQGSKERVHRKHRKKGKSRAASKEKKKSDKEAKRASKSKSTKDNKSREGKKGSKTPRGDRDSKNKISEAKPKTPRESKNKIPREERKLKKESSKTVKPTSNNTKDDGVRKANSKGRRSKKTDSGTLPVTNPADYDEGEWDDTLVFDVPDLKKIVAKKTEIVREEGSWDDLEPQSPKQPTTKVTSKAGDVWDDDFDIPSDNISHSKPKKADKWDDLEQTTTKASKQPAKNTDVWDDDFDLSPTTSKPTNEKVNTVKHTPKQTDEDVWDDDFDLPTIPNKSTQSKNTDTNEDENSWGDEKWDDDFAEIPTISTVLPIKPTANPPKDEENRDDDFGKSTKAPVDNLSEEKWSDEKWSEEEPDKKDDGDFFSGGAFDFSAKLSQIANKQSEVEEENIDDFDDIFDDEDFMAGTGDTFPALSSQVALLFDSFSADESDEFIHEIAEELIKIFKCNVDEKSRLVRHIGAIQILEVLETVPLSSAEDALRLINQIVEGDGKVQENLCLVGGIPSVLEFVDEDDVDKEVRMQVAKFVKEVCSGSTLTHQMFIACRGIPYLVGFLKTDNYKEDKDLIFMAIDGIQSVFELQSTTPKNDFCRLLVKCDGLQHISSALLNIVKTKKDNVYSEKLLQILLHFSSGDSVVKAAMADDSKGGVLQTLMECLVLLKNKEEYLVLLLKSIKQLSMDTVSLIPLQNVGAIKTLINLFSVANISTDTVNQLVSALYNLTRIDRVRQEQAARAGIIPHLMRIIDNNSPLKQFALEIILDLGKTTGGRAELSKVNGVEYYLELLTKYNNWRVNTFDVLASWLRDDEEVQKIISQPANLNILVSEFIASRSNKPIFVNLVEKIFRVVQSCSPIRAALAENKEFVSCILDGLLGKSFENLVRVVLMRIVVSLSEATDFATFAKTHQLESSLVKLKADRSIIVADLAETLYNKHYSK